MKLETAVTLFRLFEREREPKRGEFPIRPSPIYDVRLDASTDRHDERTYSLRITAGPGMKARESADRWLAVFEEAAAHDLSVTVQNNGVELR